MPPRGGRADRSARRTPRLYDLAALREEIAATRSTRWCRSSGRSRSDAATRAAGCTGARRRRTSSTPALVLQARSALEPDPARPRPCRARSGRARACATARRRWRAGRTRSTPCRSPSGSRRPRGPTSSPLPHAARRCRGRRARPPSSRARPARSPRSATEAEAVQDAFCRRLGLAQRRRPLARDPRPPARPRSRALRDRRGGRADRGRDRPAPVDGDRRGRRAVD